MFLAIIFSLLSTQSLANAEIKFTPPLNWQPNPYNNSTAIQWFQNSTGSHFIIIKSPDNPDNPGFPLFFIAPLFAQFMADKGVLESADQISFGHSNYGYRYFLNVSSPSELVNSTSALIHMQPSNFSPLTTIPKSHDVPYKMMIILTEKQGELYTITFLSPKEIFDSKLNEIKPTLDSIQLSNSTAMLN
jgi:hypothetical protein